MATSEGITSTECLHTYCARCWLGVSQTAYPNVQSTICESCTPGITELTQMCIAPSVRAATPGNKYRPAISNICQVERYYFLHEPSPTACIVRRRFGGYLQGSEKACSCQVQSFGFVGFVDPTRGLFIALSPGGYFQNTKYEFCIWNLTGPCQRLFILSRHKIDRPCAKEMSFIGACS